MPKEQKIGKILKKRLKDLKKDKSPEAIKELLGYLSHRNHYVKCETEDILKKNLTRKHIDTLIDYLNSPEKKAWYAIDNVIEYLGNLKAKKAITAISQYIHHKELHVRWSAAMQLGYIGSKEAIPTLLAMLEDPDYRVVISACNSLLFIDDASVKGCLEEKISKFTSYYDKLYLSFTVFMLSEDREKSKMHRLEYVLKCLTRGNAKRMRYLRLVAAEVLVYMAKVSANELRQIMLDRLKQAVARESMDDVKEVMQKTIKCIEEMIKEEERNKAAQLTE